MTFKYLKKEVSINYETAQTTLFERLRLMEIAALIIPLVAKKRRNRI
jgi:hypothetical protein